jgi:predicted transposase YbfD/YdcC
VTLDAHHCNPNTTAQIHQAGGEYVVQVKGNQPTLLKQCQHLASTARPRGRYEENDPGHGRITTRKGQGFAMSSLSLAPRRADSGMQTLVVIKRETLTPATGKTSSETAYDISNRALTPSPKAQVKELASAIRQPWHVESDNWIYDAPFNEDNIKTRSPNQAQIIGCLRSLAMRLLRKLNVGNFQEAIENFADCPNMFETLLKRVKFS